MRVAWLGLLFVYVAFSPPAGGSAGAYPAASWERHEAAERIGWSSAGLERARRYSAATDTAAAMVIVGGRILAEWGETARRFNVHSIRKSLLSALYGIYVAEGVIDVSLSLEQIGVDDNEPSLTAAEKQARLEDLLKARSGVYHRALYESPSMKALRPPRGRHPPGTFWYYNNWDFNVLGTVFERLTRRTLFRAFKERIADPLGMQDFRLEDGSYVTGPESVHPAYPFRMTARDLARFGLLFLREGAWDGRQIVPRAWVRASVTPYSDAGESGGYGYMWWVAVDGRHLPGVRLPGGTFSAQGAGGHHVLVVPAYDLIVVHRVNTDLPQRQVSAAEFGRLLRLILEARGQG